MKRADESGMARRSDSDELRIWRSVTNGLHSSHGQTGLLWMIRHVSSQNLGVRADVSGRARLAYVDPDGNVGYCTVRRTYGIEGDKQSLDCVVDKPVRVDAADRRQITALQWLDVGHQTKLSGFDLIF